MKISYAIPDKRKGTKQMIIDDREAIRRQKAAIKKTHPKFKYQNDQDALDDFMDIHWAKILDEEELDII